MDLELVKRLLAATKAPTLRTFLTREFCNISDDYARAAFVCLLGYLIRTSKAWVAQATCCLYERMHCPSYTHTQELRLTADKHAAHC